MHLDPRTNQAVYLPVSTKLAIAKKKASKLSAEEEEHLKRKQQELTPHFMVLVPRASTTKEIAKN